jgi:hypothetical protein
MAHCSLIPDAVVSGSWQYGHGSPDIMVDFGPAHLGRGIFQFGIDSVRATFQRSDAGPYL